MLLLLAKLFENNLIFKKFDDRHQVAIQATFHKKEDILMQAFDFIEPYAKKADADSCFLSFQVAYYERLKNNGLYVFLYLDDTLRYWSTKDIAVPDLYASSVFDYSFISIGNNAYASGKYSSFVRRGDGYKIVGLILLKNVYGYENKYIKTAFQKDFKLPPSAKIYNVPRSTFQFNDRSGKFVWALCIDSSLHYEYQIYVPAIIYTIALIVIFFLFDSIYRLLRTRRGKNCYTAILLFILTGIRLAMKKWQLPGIYMQLEIFNPIYFGSNWFPSLGNICLWAIFILFFTIEVDRFYTFPRANNRWKYLYLFLAFFALISYFFFFSFTLSDLVINSSGIFEQNDTSSLFNWTAIFVFPNLLLLILSFALFLNKTVTFSRRSVNLVQSSIVFICALAVMVFLTYQYITLITILFAIIIVFLFKYIREKNTNSFKYYHFVHAIFVISLFTSIQITYLTNFKYDNKKIILINSLAMQRDLTAEFLLIDISENIISNTSTLTDYVYDDNPLLLNFITNSFFSSQYWSRYSFNYWICRDDQPFDRYGAQTINCIEHFRNITRSVGVKLKHSEFWLIEQPNERSKYLGWFRIARTGEPVLQLFIEFSVRNPTIELGYPELLFDSRFDENKVFRGFSYAKYRNNRRIYQYGDYKYNLTADDFQTEIAQYRTLSSGDKEHFIYRPNADDLIIISHDKIKIVDVLLTFSYVFSLFFIFFSTIVLFRYLSTKHKFRWTLRNKIQYSLVFVTLAAFLLVLAFTVFYTYRQYWTQNSNNLEEKINSVYAEIQDIIYLQLDENDDKLSILSDWLLYFQKIFATDINLFNSSGHLLYTTHPEIFIQGHSGRHINPNAYINLALRGRSSIVEREEIGGLKYLSAYETLTDTENNVIAFLNLPYFMRQETLREDITTVIVVLLNFYMFIMLITVIVAIIMSNHITQPLLMLQETFKKIKLGGDNDIIKYNRNDEIGVLVQEYNKTLDELAISATQLARSERESAWREIAKQIAHEINNPLTPMKLSIQHLKRAYDNKSEHFDMYMKKIPASMVEQIDNLSEIASEFSNFAEMPAPNIECIDLIDKINTVIPLFAVNDNKHAFKTNYNNLTKAIILADKEQIARVFINLIKNSLQAIPANKQAEIYIEISKISNNRFQILLIDNGVGIPADMRKRIFSPYFTSKSSGKGIGLSIVHNIIESIGGSIRFETSPTEGTAFFITIPEATITSI
jgi:signal transduction histidine kinase